MNFPVKDFTNQFISSSYQDVLQQYLLTDTLYFLDGYGNVVCSFPSSSVGNNIITNDVTSSMTVASSSYASYCVTSSYYQITSSIVTTTSADFALLAGEAIHTNTASYILPPSYKSISTDYVISEADSIIYANASSSNITLTLPTASFVGGKLFRIKKVDVSSNQIFITSSVNIDFNTQFNLSQSGSFINLHCDSSQYWRF
jgi:hypothetical protein